MTKGISIETVLNSRCSCDFDGNPTKDHWGVFIKDKYPSRKVIQRVLQCCKVPQFSDGKLLLWFEDGYLFLGFEKTNDLFKTRLLHIESGMQQEAVYLACTALGLGTCIRNLGINGIEHEDKIATARHLILEKANIESIVIHHGVETSFFNTSISAKAARMRLKLPLDAKIVLWSDQINIHKDLVTLLKAIPFVVKEVPEVMFIIHGRAVEKTYLDSISPLLSRLRQHYNKHLKVKYGWTPYLKMPTIYRAADLYVKTSRYETFGLGTVEAMAVGFLLLQQMERQLLRFLATLENYFA